MHTKLSGKILSMKRNELSTGTTIELAFDMQGSVADANIVAGKDARLTGVLHLKPIVADKLNIGATITIFISDEDISIT